MLTIEELIAFLSELIILWRTFAFAAIGFTIEKLQPEVRGRAGLHFGYDMGSVEIGMNSSHPVFSLCLFLMIPIVAESQNPVFSTVPWFSDFQEHKESERPETEKGNAQSISKAIERLKRAVNGNSVVRNQCDAQGHTVEIEEKTEIAEVDRCKLIVKTVKTTNPGADGPELHFTLHANLTDLSTPASVVPLSFSHCQPMEGSLVRVMSRTQPGKIIRTAQNSTSQLRDAQPHTEQKEAPGRKDLSFFFSDIAVARKAAGALDRAVALCGGKEWPDEDDLP